MIAQSVQPVMTQVDPIAVSGHSRYRVKPIRRYQASVGFLIAWLVLATHMPGRLPGGVLMQIIGCRFDACINL